MRRPCCLKLLRVSATEMVLDNSFTGAARASQAWLQSIAPALSQGPAPCPIIYGAVETIHNTHTVSYSRFDTERNPRIANERERTLLQCSARRALHCRKRAVRTLHASSPASLPRSLPRAAHLSTFSYRRRELQLQRVTAPASRSPRLAFPNLL